MGGVPLRPRADHRGAGRVFPTFFVWYRPDLSEFVVCRLEEWSDRSRKALGQGWRAFAELIGGLPRWRGDTAGPPPAARHSY